MGEAHDDRYDADGRLRTEVSAKRPVVRVCAAIIRDDAILMVRHVHDGEDYWTLPGGGVEAGETPEQAVVREVREEVCMRGSVGARLFERDAGARNGSEVCFAFEVPADEVPRVGGDPELPGDAQLLIALAWRPLAEVADDVQVAQVLAALPGRD